MAPGLLCVAALAVPTQADAAPAVSLTGTVQAAGGSAAAPANAVVAVKVAIDPPMSTPAALPGSGGGRLPSTKQLTFRFGTGLVAGLGAFSSCTGEALRATGPDACPEGSQLGTAEATFEAYVGGSTLAGHTDVGRLFRGDGEDGVLLYVHASEPADSTLVLPGRLLPDGDPFATKLVLDATPAANVQGFDVALRTVSLLLDAKGTGAAAAAPSAPAAAPRLPDCKRLRGARRRRCVRRSRDLELCPKPARGRARRAAARDAAEGTTLLRSTGCPGGGYALRADLDFSDGSSGTADAKAACS